MVEGHTAGARENRLQAYVALGPSSCHESITLEQARDRLHTRSLDHGASRGTRKELGELAPIFSESCDLRRLVLVTDGQNPRGFLKEGIWMGQCVRRWRKARLLVPSTRR
jgi:adenine deaminase